MKIPTPFPPAGSHLERLYQSIHENEQEVMYLASRWKDEHRYEDIETYRPRFQNCLPNGAAIRSMLKMPFGAVVSFEGRHFAVKILLSGHVRIHSVTKGN